MITNIDQKAFGNCTYLTSMIYRHTVIEDRPFISLPLRIQVVPVKSIMYMLDNTRITWPLDVACLSRATKMFFYWCLISHDASG